jgi:hypothetical protein
MLLCALHQCEYNAFYEYLMARPWRKFFFRHLPNNYFFTFERIHFLTPLASCSLQGSTRGAPMRAKIQINSTNFTPIVFAAGALYFLVLSKGTAEDVFVEMRIEKSPRGN